MVERSEQLRTELAGALGADQVLTGEGCRPYAVQGHVPTLVARPGDVEGVGQALSLATAAGATVVPRGGGTSMALGYPPPSVDVVLSLERLSRVLAHDPSHLTATLEAGCTLDQATRALARAGQMLPLDAPLPARATIGGALATGLAGPRRLLYGSPRDLLLGARVVSAAGIATWAGEPVVRHAAGYDLKKVYVGSLGTLGVVVEASFRLVPLPEHEGTLLATYAEPLHALIAARALIGLPVGPCAVSVLLLEGLPQLAARLSATEGEALVAARFPGPPAAVERAMREGDAAVRVAGCDSVAQIEGDAQAALWDAVADFPVLADLPPDDAVLKVGVLPGEVGNVVEMAVAVAGEHGLRLYWLADAGIGTVYLRVRALDVRPDDDEHARAQALAPGLRALQEMQTHRWRNAVVLGCAPALKADLPIWGANPPAIEIMHAIKHQFDPAGTLNPGRFVGGL
jgi:glycolate oxidase FAD binding subunit